MRRLAPLPAMVGLWALVYGLWLMAPWITFDSSPAYSQLAQWGNEKVYGVAFVVTGVAILQCWSPRGRFCGHAMSVVLSLMLAAAFASANWRGTAIPTYGTIAFGCAWGLIEGTRP